MLQQTKNAKKALKSVGFGKSDASVRVTRNYIPKSCGGDGRQYEYGDLEIFLKDSTSRATLTRASRLAKAGFNVHVLLDGDASHVGLEWNHGNPGSITTSDLTQEPGPKRWATNGLAEDRIQAHLDQFGLRLHRF